MHFWFSAVEVSIETSELKEAIRNGAKLEVYHVPDNGREERIENVSALSDGVSFSAESFSTYVIKEHEDEQVKAPRVTYHFLGKGDESETAGEFTSEYYTFINKSGNIVSREIVKNNEKMSEPPTPPPIYDNNGTIKYRFYGWYRVNLVSKNDSEVTYTWPGDDSRMDFSQPVTVTDAQDGTDVYLAALYQNSRFIVFHEDALGYPNAIRFAQKKVAALNSNSANAWADVVISDASAPLQRSNQEYFYGWSYYDNNGIKHEEPLYDTSGNPITGKTIRVTSGIFQEVTITEDGEEYDVNSATSLDLYPEYKIAHWLNFDTNAQGSGALYIQSKFVMSNTIVASLPVTNMKGYYFDGWYTAAQGGTMVADSSGVLQNGIDTNGVKVSGGQLTLSSDATLYAHWTASNSSSYRIVYWFQNPDDDGYSFVKAETITGQTAGSQTNVTNAQAPATPNISGLTIPDGEKAAGFHRYGSNLTNYPGETDNKYILKQETISNDGETVVNVYYNRNVYSVYFHNRQSTSTAYRINDLTITAKYGADVHQLWPGIRSGTEGVYSTMWYMSTSSSSNMVSGISTMMLNGYTYYQFTKSGYKYNNVFMVEPIGGSENADDYIFYVDHPFEFNSGGLRTDTEDYPHITGFRLNAMTQANATSIKNDAESKGSDPDAVYESNKPKSPTINAYYYSGSGTPVEGVSAYREQDGNTYQTLYFYYLRNKYTITYDLGYDGLVENVSDIYYEQDISDKALPGYVVGVTERTIGNKDMIFKGWYDNEARTGEPYDFSGKHMPAHDLKLYAKWELKWYLVEVDPCGGELLDGMSTWFWVEHGDSISRYNISNNYIEASPDYEGTKYYYAYEAYDPRYDRSSTEYDSELAAQSPARYRRAKYITQNEFSQYKDWDIDTTTVYQQQFDAFSLKGWYIVNSETDGITHVPYQFGAPVTENVKIRAMWRRSESYFIYYDATNTAEGTDGQSYTVTGNLAQNVNDPVIYEEYDPSPPGRKIGYSDKAQISVHPAPEDYSSAAAPDQQWEFEGWRPYIGNQPIGSLYSPGDSFMVDSRYADSIYVITLKAEYKAKDQSMHLPDTVSLFLDGNSQEHGGGFVVDGADYSDNRYIGTISAYNDGSGFSLPAGTLNKGVAFVGEENNFDVRLIKYGDAFSSAFYNEGRTVFRSETGFLLLGWDKISDPELKNFIPSFAADGVVGMDYYEENTNVLYAMWEPLLYLTFENQTDSDLEFSLSGLDSTTMSVINVVEGIYKRERYTDDKIKVEAGKTLKLVLPKAQGLGAEKFNISGAAGQLGDGKVLKVQTTAVSPDISDEGVEFTNAQTFTLKSQATLRRVSDPENSGVKVTFTQRNAWKLTLQPNGGNALQNDTFYFNYLSDTNTLPVPTRSNYLFAGWARTANGDPEFGAGPVSGTQIFVPPETKEQTLYAKWKSASVTVPVRYFVRAADGTLTEYAYNDSFWKTGYRPPQNITVSTSSVDLAYTFKHSNNNSLIRY